MGYASYFEDNEEAVAEARALDRKAGRRAAARIKVERIRRFTPAGSLSGKRGSEPRLAKAEVSHATLERLMRHFDRLRNV